jgi:hypothetical protein
LREIARAHSEKAFARVLQLIDSKDERVALMAFNTVLDRAWGKAEARGEVPVVRAFAVVPQVMSRADWLKTRGDPNLLGKRGDPDRRQEWRGASLEAPAKSVQTLTPCRPIERS